MSALVANRLLQTLAAIGTWDVQAASRRRQREATLAQQLYNDENRSMKRPLLAAFAALLVLPAAQLLAEVFFVKYRGTLDLAPLRCDWLTRSSLVQRLCFDARNQNVVVTSKAPTTTIAACLPTSSLNGGVRSRWAATSTLPLRGVTTAG
jgi:hypothetical protein